MGCASSVQNSDQVRSLDNRPSSPSSEDKFFTNSAQKSNREARQRRSNSAAVKKAIAFDVGLDPTNIDNVLRATSSRKVHSLAPIAFEPVKLTPEMIDQRNRDLEQKKLRKLEKMKRRRERSLRKSQPLTEEQQKLKFERKLARAEQKRHERQMATAEKHQLRQEKARQALEKSKTMKQQVGRTLEQASDHLGQLQASSLTGGRSDIRRDGRAPQQNSPTDRRNRNRPTASPTASAATTGDVSRASTALTFVSEGRRENVNFFDEMKY